MGRRMGMKSDLQKNLFRLRIGKSQGATGGDGRGKRKINLPTELNFLPREGDGNCHVIVIA